LEHIGDVRAQPLTRRVCADRHCRYRRRKGEIRCGRCGETGHEDIPIRQVHARRNLSTMLVLRRSRWGDRTARAEAAGQAALNLDGDISAELDDVRPSPEYL
ncbi:MAG: hypothetical protein ACRDXE_08155, partial [Acidimicrobiales bacterium]